MKAAVFYAPSDIRIEERSIPTIDGKEILVKVKAAAICGTDLRIYKGTKKIKTPRIIGHEFAGDIEKAGDGTEFRIGDRVTVYPVISCGKCYACMINLYG